MEFKLMLLRPVAANPFAHCPFPRFPIAHWPCPFSSVQLLLFSLDSPPVYACVCVCTPFVFIYKYFTLKFICPAHFYGLA